MAALVLLLVLVLVGIMFLVLAFIGIMANPWDVLSGVLLGSVLYYVHYQN